MAAARRGKNLPGTSSGSTSAPSTSTEAAVEKRILDFCQEIPSGITNKVLQSHISDVEPAVQATVINKLLSSGRMVIYRQGNELLYKASVSSGQSKGADTEEKIVYSIVEEAGNKGIWIRDIRYKSNLMMTQLNKILKSLEGKKLIKAVKSVAASKKKVYMLYNLEPDRSVTGGSWYSDQDFESEFVDVLNQQCYRFLQQKLESAREAKVGPIACKNQSFASSKEVWKYISELGISKVQLSLEDIEMILDTLIYDGKVDKKVMAEGSGKSGEVKLYRAIDSMVPLPGLMCMPCGVCPVMKDCGKTGIITPFKCQYMSEWLE